MKDEKSRYFDRLTQGSLDQTYVTALLRELRTHLTVEEVPEELFRRTVYQHKITEKLSRFPLYVARGRAAWRGLVMGFPGSAEQLTKSSLGTPFLRSLLYPVLDLHRRIGVAYGMRMPCLYLLGGRFPDAVLRRFRLLSNVIPHVIVLTNDMLSAAAAARSAPVLAHPQKLDEAWVHVRLIRDMQESQEGLRVPVEEGDIRLDYLVHELPTGEATRRSERLDILAVDKTDKSLVAFEVKGPNPGRVELESLFLQGLEHREWLERNKMGVKLITEGPKGQRINVKKRVRLVLGCFDERLPELFWAMRREAIRRDPLLRIDFVKLGWAEGEFSELTLARRTELDRVAG